MVYIGTHDCYENIKLKLWSTVSILKAWPCRDFQLQKENSCKVWLCFVNCCTLVIVLSEGCQIIYYFSRVSQMGLTGGGRQFGQNGQKLHENDKIGIFGSKQWGGGGAGQANFSGSGGIPPVPPTRGNPAFLCWTD